RIICDLIPSADGPHHVVDLCAGEGLLSQALLEADPRRTVHVFDGSDRMLDRAGTLLSRYRARVDFRAFDIFSHEWRRFECPVDAVVSSLAVHHLDGPQKQALFGDIASALSGGGVFILADVVRPASELSRHVAKRLWDQAVQERALS